MKVGVMLGLSHSRLLKMDSSTFLKDMVHAWLQREDDVVQWSGPPTWDSLAKALKGFDYTSSALDIEGSYINFSSTKLNSLVCIGTDVYFRMAKAL